MILPVFVIEVRTELNVPKPDMYPELEMAPPELVMVPLL